MDFFSWDMVVLFVLGLIGAVVTFFNIKRPGAPVTPAVPGPSPVQVAEEKKAAEAISVAEKEHEEKVKVFKEDHDFAVEGQVLELKEQTEAVKDDTSSTNAVLLDVGKTLRE